MHAHLAQLHVALYTASWTLPHAALCQHTVWLLVILFSCSLQELFACTPVQTCLCRLCLPLVMSSLALFTSHPNVQLLHCICTFYVVLQGLGFAVVGFLNLLRCAFFPTGCMNTGTSAMPFMGIVCTIAGCTYMYCGHCNRCTEAVQLPLQEPSTDNSSCRLREMQDSSVLAVAVVGAACQLSRWL